MPKANTSSTVTVLRRIDPKTGGVTDEIVEIGGAK